MPLVKAFLPLLLTQHGGEGRGEEARFVEILLSPALSPFVPSGQRENTFAQGVCCRDRRPKREAGLASQPGLVSNRYAIIKSSNPIRSSGTWRTRKNRSGRNGLCTTAEGFAW